MKKLNMLMLMAALIFGACKKNGNDTTEPTTACKIVSVKEGDDPASTYTYDINGKVSKVTNLYGFGDGVFTYETGKVNFIDAKGAENQSFNVDASGRIISDDFDIYKYNADGYLIEKTGKGSTTPEFVLSYSNGNLVKVITDGAETTDITYYDNEPYQNLLGYENALYSNLLFNQHTFSSLTATFTGKSSKNLVKDISKQITRGGIIQKFKETYVYKKDQDGKVISLNVTSESPAGYYNGVNTISFTYQCQ